LFSWKIPEDARASGNGILIDGFAGDATAGVSRKLIASKVDGVDSR